MVTTVAPTIPVDAASKAPTTATETPRPPRKPVKQEDMLSRRFSAIFDFLQHTTHKHKQGDRDQSLIGD